MEGHSVRIDPNLERFALALAKAGSLVPETARLALYEGIWEIAQVAATKRMTAANPPYLNVRTGMGRASVERSARAVIEGSVVRASFGSQLKYIRAHEMGFSGIVGVRPHARKPSNRGRALAQSVLSHGTTKWARKGRRNQTVGFVFVRGHARKMELRARHFLLHSLQGGIFRTHELMSAALRLLIENGKIPTIAQIRAAT